jgi:hypothetical protein
MRSGRSPLLAHGCTSARECRHVRFPPRSFEALDSWNESIGDQRSVRPRLRPITALLLA